MEAQGAKVVLGDVELTRKEFGLFVRGVGFRVIR